MQPFKSILVGEGWSFLDAVLREGIQCTKHSPKVLFATIPSHASEETNPYVSKIEIKMRIRHPP